MISGLLIFVGLAILITVVYALGVRAVALLYPRSDPRRVELIAERYKVPRKERLLWIFEQFETAWLDGREARAEARAERKAARRLPLLTHTPTWSRPRRLATGWPPST